MFFSGSIETLLWRCLRTDYSSSNWVLPIPTYPPILHPVPGFSMAADGVTFVVCMCGQWSIEQNIKLLINFLGTSKYIQTMGKTYNAQQITLTQKAHYQHIPQFPTL